MDMDTDNKKCLRISACIRRKYLDMDTKIYVHYQVYINFLRLFFMLDNYINNIRYYQINTKNKNINKIHKEIHYFNFKLIKLFKIENEK